MPRDRFNRGRAAMANYQALAAANDRFRNGNIASWPDVWSPNPGWQNFRERHTKGIRTA